MTPAQGSEHQRVLVVEDDREVRHLLSVILAADDREVVAVATGAEAERVLEEGEFDLMLLDLILPDRDGRSLLRKLGERQTTAALPVMVVSARGTPDIRAECFSLGADAFVEKPFDPHQLVLDVQARLQRAARRDRRALSDTLTGLLNRAGILNALETDAPVAVLAAGIDGFHDLVERAGWEAAERTVAQIGSALREALSPETALGRLAGGEFAAVITGARADAAREEAVAMVEAARALSVAGPDGETFRLTLSVGIARGRPGDSSSEALLEQAERREFRAQEAGGNRVVAEEEEVAAPPRPILIAEDDDITATILRHRLEKEGFTVLRYANGREAYKGALEVTPSLVILDVKMPGMDGFELLERLRRTPSYAKVPIVILTSMGSEPDVVRAFQLGADDYINKPFSPSELVARLRRFLARSARSGD